MMEVQGGYANLFNAQKELEEGYKDVAHIMAKEVRA